jgi:hypothetical protein
MSCPQPNGPGNDHGRADGKQPTPTRKQGIHVQAAMRDHIGKLESQGSGQTQVRGRPWLDAYGAEAAISQPTISAETVENDPKRLSLRNRSQPGKIIVCYLERGSIYRGV